MDIRIKRLLLNFYFFFIFQYFLFILTKVLICNRLEVKNNHNNSVTGPSYERLEMEDSGLPSSLEQRLVYVSGVLSKLSFYFVG